jgi:hypothetical protein
MAQVLSLVKRKDLAAFGTESGSDILDLLPWLAREGWVQNTSQAGEDVEEAISLNVSGASHDLLAAAIQSIDAKIHESILTRSLLQLNGIWLRAKLDGETNTRQAYVTTLRRGKAEVFSPFVKDSFLPDYQIGLTRKPYWEGIAQVDIATGASINVNGGKLAYTLDGDVPGRIAKMVVTAETNSLQNLNRFWIGIQDTRYGTPANFQPIWTLHPTGGHNPAIDFDTTESSDATAVSGYKQTCTFATVPTMAQRTAETMYEVLGGGGAFNDQRGIYRVLLRAKTTSTRAARVRLKTGFSYNSGYYFGAYGNRTPISNTNWGYYDLGVVSIPSWKIPADLDLRYQFLAIEAESVSGSGNLDLDCLMLVPAEHQIYIQSVDFAVVNSSVGDDFAMDVLSFPDGQLTALLRRQDPAYPYPLENVLPSQTEWALPQGSGVIVVVATGSNSYSGQKINLDLDVYERWAVLRGTE